MDMIERLETMLAQGQDSAMLRFGLGQAYLDRDPAEAARHLREALAFDAHYSAAWKLLGRALDAAGDTAGAVAAFEQGIDAAEEKGDVQAAKEMQVFRKRIAKRGDA